MWSRVNVRTLSSKYTNILLLYLTLSPAEFTFVLWRYGVSQFRCVNVTECAQVFFKCNSMLPVGRLSAIKIAQAVTSSRGMGRALVSIVSGSRHARTEACALTRDPLARTRLVSQTCRTQALSSYAPHLATPPRASFSTSYHSIFLCN